MNTIYQVVDVLPLLSLIMNDERGARQLITDLENAGRIRQVNPSHDVQVAFEIIERRNQLNRRGIDAERRVAV